jgi:hypothetical protein
VPEVGPIAGAAGDFGISLTGQRVQARELAAGMPRSVGSMSGTPMPTTAPAGALGDLRRAHRAHDHYRAGRPVSL